jgi:hypothetical protein
MSESLYPELPSEDLPWAAMFVAYAQGTPLPEIAAAFGVSEPVLDRAARAQGWPAIASRNPLGVSVSPPNGVEAQVRLAEIETNRRANLHVAEMLRETLVDHLTRLKAGTLKMEKAFNNKGSIAYAELEPGPQDLQAYAAAAKTVSEMTYRALGDVLQGDAASGSGKGDGDTYIILPPAVATDRANQAPVEKPATVIDLSQPHS